MTGTAITAERALAERVVEAVRSVTGDAPVTLHAPEFSGNEWQYVKECIDSTYVSSVGAFVDRFERDLAEYTGAAHAVAVANGTAALHMALLLAGVQRDDEVLVQSMTFVATAAAVRYCGAVPHFVDVEERTLGLDAAALRAHLGAVAVRRGRETVNRHTGRVLRAVVPMHTFGHPVNLDSLLEVAAEYGISVVEDAAESLGSSYRGRHTGTVGLLGTLSFNGNKTITTGGGGAVLTNDPALARRAKHLTTTAKLPHRWEFVHDEVGFNYRMPNINAALGCAQLEQLPRFVEEKRRLYGRYRDALATVPGVRLFREPEESRSNYWLQALVLDDAVAHARDEILESANASGVMTRPVWTLMHLLAPYADCPRAELPVAESLARRIINLPSSAVLGAGAG